MVGLCGCLGETSGVVAATAVVSGDDWGMSKCETGAPGRLFIRQFRHTASGFLRTSRMCRHEQASVFPVDSITMVCSSSSGGGL